MFLKGKGLMVKILKRSNGWKKHITIALTDGLKNMHLGGGGTIGVKQLMINVDNLCHKQKKGHL